ncbi:VapE domain-containing protein [Mesorhizobium escarrei]|uniref:Prim-Pol domain-containing protein n=1 Tax=Mesorhizobium escarrei TaxID=666018 RepID=A0ABM9E5W1_9HYPH|nr:VapE domain-containing protein [Mesorhizobium escarrei]CAH2404511.1 Prim-Pol domain-containing protein [Mesorhizobium escarrei]
MTNAPTVDSVLGSARPLIEAGASLHWLVPFEKRPIANDWSNAPLQTEALLRASYRNNANIGIRLGEPSKTEGGYLHVFDLDIRKPELAAEAWAVVESLWPGARSLPSVISGSGGDSRHLYFLTDKPLRKKTLAQSKGFEKIWDERQQRHVVKRDWMIDLFGTGVQVVLPPSIHPDTKLPYRWERHLDLDMIGFGIGPIIPGETVEKWGVQSSVVEASDEEDDLFDLVRSEPMDLDDAQIADILKNIPNDGAGAHYDDYVQVGMALHHQFRGSNEGFERWCEWAKQSEKFEAKNAAVRWRSFSQDSKNPVRMATLMQIASNNKLKAEFDFDDGFNLPAVVDKSDLSDLLGASDSNDLSDLVGGAPKPTAKAAEKDDYDPDWVQRLDRNEEGALKSTLPNVNLIVECDPRTRGTVAYSEFKRTVVLRGTGRKATKKRDSSHEPVNLEGKLWQINDPLNGDPWSGHHDNAIRHLLESKTQLKGYGLKVTTRDLEAGVNMAAIKRSFHPVKELLESETWDGKCRAETLFIDYLGCDDTPYYRQAALMTLVGAVARIYRPGHKFDFVPILEGVQGKGKSTFIEILGLHWYMELTGDISEPAKMIEAMQGSWILEIGELSAMQRSEVNDLKAFVSRTQDKARLAWDRRVQDYPRQCIFIGSTNDREYLRDQTGGRRFWPIQCKLEGQIDNPRLRREILQVWAEALHIFRRMEAEHNGAPLPLYLTDEAAKAAVVMQESRRIESAEEVLAGQITSFLDQPIGTDDRFDDLDPDAPKTYRNETCIRQLWEEMLGRDGAVPHTETVKIGRAMLLVGWPRSAGVVQGREITKKWGNCRVYTRPQTAKETP